MYHKEAEMYIAMPQVEFLESDMELQFDMEHEKNQPPKFGSKELLNELSWIKKLVGV